MTDSKKGLAGFLYQGQVAQSDIDLLLPRDASVGLTFESVSRKVAIKDLDEKYTDSAKKMSAVYVCVASFENMLRDLISDVLIEEKGSDWWTSGSVSSDIQKKANRKYESEKSIRWHSSRGGNMIAFTELKDLVAIIGSNWDLFEGLLADLDWVRHTVKQMERSRNVIMHSGQLSVEDIERIGSVTRDWIRQIGA